MIRRKPFADVIRRQLDLFEREHADVIRDCDKAEDAYNRADRDEAEELYGDYLLEVEAGTEILAGIRDAYASTLDDEPAATYEDSFHRAVAKRLPRFALTLPDT